METLMQKHLAVSPSHSAVNVDVVVSPRGLRFWLVPSDAVPLVSLEFAMRGGSAQDPAAKAGLSALMSALLDEGAGDLDSQAFQAKLSELAVDFTFDAGQDDFIGRMRTLTAHREEAFELLHLALTRPRIDAAPLDRIHAQVLAVIAQLASDPDSIAEQAWSRLMFDGHPYGRAIEGNAKSLVAITATDLRRFAAMRFGRDQMRIAVVGDIDAAELGPLLDRSFGDLPAKAASIAVPNVVPSASGGIAVIDRDLDQSVVLFGEAGIARDDPDFYAAILLDDIMGGGNFASRLESDIREKRGLVYSVETGLVMLDHAALLTGDLGTKNASVAEAIERVRAEWQRMHDSGPTAGELADAKTHLIGEYPLRFVSTRDSADTLLDIELAGLPIDYVDKRAGYIDRVTLADAKRVARRLYDASALRFLVLGHPVSVKGDLAAPPID
jgi:zinc protease